MGRKRTVNACVEVQRTGTIASFRKKYSGALHLRNGTGYLGYKYLAALPLLKPKPLKILSEMGAERSNGAINDVIFDLVRGRFRSEKLISTKMRLLRSQPLRLYHKRPRNIARRLLLGFPQIS